MRVILLTKIILLIISFSHALGETFSASVIWVFDGDSIKLENNIIVRLQGIDAPEMGKENQAEQYYAREALWYVINKTQKKKVMVKWQGISDRYGRRVGHVLVEGQSLNLKLISEGLAYCYEHRDTPEKFANACVKEQRQAMTSQKGFWSKVLGSAQSSRYIGNKKSKRFYVPSCRKAKSIKEKNRVEFSDVHQPFWEGYSPARECFFWPETVRE